MLGESTKWKCRSFATAVEWHFRCLGLPLYSPLESAQKPWWQEIRKHTHTGRKKLHLIIWHGRTFWTMGTSPSKSERILAHRRAPACTHTCSLHNECHGKWCFPDVDGHAIMTEWSGRGCLHHCGSSQMNDPSLEWHNLLCQRSHFHCSQWFPTKIQVAHILTHIHLHIYTQKKNHRQPQVEHEDGNLPLQFVSIIWYSERGSIRCWPGEALAGGPPLQTPICPALVQWEYPLSLREWAGGPHSELSPSNLFRDTLPLYMEVTFKCHGYCCQET